MPTIEELRHWQVQATLDWDVPKRQVVKAREGKVLSSRLSRWRFALLVTDVLVCLEALAILASGLVAAYTAFSVSGSAVGTEWLHLSDAVVALSACLFAPFVIPQIRSGRGLGAHDRSTTRPKSQLMELRSFGGAAIRTTLAVAALCGGLSMLAAFVVTSTLTTPIGTAIWFTVALMSVTVLRLSSVILVRWLERLRLTSETIVIIGQDETALKIARVLHKDTSPWETLIHVIPDSEFTRNPSVPLQIKAQQLASAVLPNFPDRVIIATDGSISSAASALLEALRCQDVRVDLAWKEISGLRPPTAECLGDGFFLLCLVRRSFEGWALLTKVSLDKVLATALLVFLAPLMLLSAAAIRIETPGPVIFRQTRHGWNNTKFEILKFRTMVWQDRTVADGSCQTTRNDPRVTRVGRLLRCLSIDELPQLLNVLWGEMSLVGPRPLPVAMLTNGRRGEEIIPEYSQRHRAPPGITGLAQVRGWRGAVDTDEHLRQRVAADLSYINNWSILLDLRLLLETPLKVLVSRNNAF